MSALSLVAVAYAAATLATTLAIGARARAPGSNVSAHIACALAAGAIGATLAGRVVGLETLVVAGIVTALLGAVSYAGFRGDGMPPDVVCGGLAIVLAAALILGSAAPFVGAAVAGSPFLITSLLVGNERASLRDGAVAAIGGSLLGVEAGIVTTILGSIVGALAIARAPVGARSLAPFLACAIGLGIAAVALFAI